MLVGCGRCLLPATLYCGIASAAQRADKLFSIAQNDCQFQRAVRCARVRRCDFLLLPYSRYVAWCLVICIQPKPDESFSKSDTFFFLLGFVYRRIARMCATDACRSSHIHFLPNSLTFYSPIKNHISRKSGAHSHHGPDPFHFSSSARTSESNSTD